MDSPLEEARRCLREIERLNKDMKLLCEEIIELFTQHIKIYGKN